MFLHRGFADAEDHGDVAVGFALGGPQQGLGGARGQAELDQRLMRGEVRFKFALGLFGALEPRGDGSQQLGLRNRLGQIIIGPQVHARAQIFALAFGREKNERDGRRCRVRAQRLQHAVAVQFRHHYVAQDEVGHFLFCQLRANAAILGGDRLKLLQPENRRQVASHLRLVFDYQNLFHDAD